MGYQKANYKRKGRPINKQVHQNRETHISKILHAHCQKFGEKDRSREDSNLQSSDPQSDALSVAPRDLVITRANNVAISRTEVLKLQENKDISTSALEDINIFM